MFERMVEVTGVGFMVLIVASIVGFFANIYQFAVGMIALASLSDITPLLVIKAIGLFVAPLGSVMGFLGFFGA